MGNYIIEKPNTEEVGAKTEFTGYDYMIKFNCTYKNRVKFPCKASVLLQDICNQAGVECGSLSFINSEYMILGNPFTNNENCKTVLSNIAQLAVGYAYIGRDNKLYIKTLKTTAHLLSVKEVHKMSVKELNMTPVYKLAGISSVAEEKVDGNNYFEFFKNNKFGKVNSLVLKISGIDGENTVENDQDSIKDDGLTEISIEDNYFLNTEEERKKVINPMWNALKGLEYLPFETTYYGYPYLDVGDPIVIADTDDKEYFSYVFNYTFEYDGSYNGTLKTEAMTKTQTAYKNSENLKSRFRRAERTINKIEGTIEDIIEQQDKNTEKLTKHEQTIDSISDKVSHIEETTNTIEGNKTIQLGNAIAGELIELHIYGNNDVFSYLTISDDVVLSDDLYLLGDSLIVITDSKGNSKEYELGIKDVLRQKDDVYDEYVFKDGKAQIIRRINSDVTIKTKETIEDLGAFSIELFDGTNTLSIKNYIASLKAKFAIQNDMTNIYASKVEMNSAINQTAEQVDINVNKKLKSYSKTTEMNAAINVKADAINQVVKKKVGEDEIVSKINQSAEEVLIHADKLDINGKAAKFKTEINAEFGPFTKDDINRVQKIILGEIEATSDDYEKYDINKEGAINSFDLLIVSRAVYAGGYYKIKGTFEIDPYSASRSLTIHRNGASSYSVALSLFGAIFSNIYTSQLNFFRTGDGNSLVINGDLFSMEDDNGNRIDLLMESYNDGTKLPALELVKRDTRTRIDSQGITTPKLTQTSLAEQKKNFEKMQDGAVDVLKNIDIYKYNLKCEKDTDKKHIGFVIGDKYNYSKEVTSLDNKGVDNYSFTSLCCKAIQELSQQVESLQNEIKILKEEKFNEINRLDK